MVSGVMGEATHHTRPRNGAARQPGPMGVGRENTIVDKIGLCPIVRRQLDAGTYRCAEDRGVDAAYQPSEAIGTEDGREGAKRGFVVMLSSDWEGWGVGLHASFNKEEGVSERCLRRSISCTHRWTRRVASYRLSCHSLRLRIPKCKRRSRLGICQGQS